MKEDTQQENMLIDEAMFESHPYRNIKLYRVLPNPKGKDLK
jgi:hypothetical protein